MSRSTHQFDITYAIYCYLSIYDIVRLSILLRQLLKQPGFVYQSFLDPIHYVFVGPIILIVIINEHPHSGEEKHLVKPLLGTYYNFKNIEDYGTFTDVL